jgi:1A family penicillin-binding protein
MPHSPGSRSARAAREFLRALGADLAVLALQLRHLLSVLRRWRSSLRALNALRPSAGWSTTPAVPRSLRRLLWGVAVAGIGATAVISGALLWALLGLPVDKPASAPQKPSLLLEAANGQPLGRVGLLRVGNVPLQDFPTVLINAVLSTEDRRFYENVGVDPLGILRAAFANRAAGGIVQGGSTITQQLVKLEYLDRDRSYVRKLREALMAVWLGEHLSKNEILTRYLNRVYLGDGAYGMAAAAQLYFGKRPADLTLAEAATLAGLIKAPSELDPLHHLAAAQARAATVLDGMVANHAIDAKAANAAKAEPAMVKAALRLAPAASWFTDWVAKSAAQLAGSQTGSVLVRTTLIPDLQALAQQIVNNELAKEGRRLGVSQGALVAMRPNGAVLAMVGGRDYHTSQFNRAIDANRQPGSSFKLFVYLAALRKGYTPQTTIDAGPIDIKGWQPQNFDKERYGRITLAEAFAQSVNTAAVRLAMDVGLDNVIAAARDLGITEPLPDVPSLALGSAGVSLLDMTGAFASVRADHMHLRPWGVAAIGEESGSRMLATLPPLGAGRTLDPYQKPLVELLQGVVEHGTGQAAALDGFAAGKTGTSQDYRDAWFIGFNDKLVVGVWLGNDDDTPMKRVVGGGLPASIWKEFMSEAGPLLDREGTPVAAAADATQQADDMSGSQPGDQGMLDAQGISGSSEPGACDYQACSSFYHSFRPSDCTYQPFDGGPRQICEKGEQQSSPPPEQVAGGAADVASHASCNIDACSRTYSSFRASDCTYEPYSGGPRQLCEK